jgi:hypothetical protein
VGRQARVSPRDHLCPCLFLLRFYKKSDQHRGTRGHHSLPARCRRTHTHTHLNHTRTQTKLLASHMHLRHTLALTHTTARARTHTHTPSTPFHFSDHPPKWDSGGGRAMIGGWSEWVVPVSTPCLLVQPASPWTTTVVYILCCRMRPCREGLALSDSLSGRCPRVWRV